MARPPALLFDLDGTLVDSAVTIALALSQLSLARGGDAIDVAAVRRLVSQGAPTLVREALGPVAGDGAADLVAFRALLAVIPATPEMIYPGVVDALTAFQGEGRACAVVTNKPEEQARQLLVQLDLARFFVMVVGGDTLPVAKPDPAPLLHALSATGYVRDSAIMIGDSAIDARAAAAADLPFALFLGGYEADLCAPGTVAGAFAHFDELPALLRSIRVPA